MWYYKVVVGILLFPWSVILLMVVGSARHRYAQKARAMLFPPATLPPTPEVPLALPAQTPTLSPELEPSVAQVS